MAGEYTSTPEALSNRRFMYEAFVSGLRMTTSTESDHSRRITGETEVTRGFTLDDYFVYTLAAYDDQPLGTTSEVNDKILESRRPIINIDCKAVDADGIKHNYMLVYPEDLQSGDGAYVSGVVRNTLPADWPANEPFIYDMQRDVRTPDAPVTYQPVLEPFTDPRLSAVYDAVAAQL